MQQKINMFLGKVLAHRIFKIFKWVFFVLVLAYIILVIGRVIYFFDQDKTNAQVEKIHNTKLTLDDVMGVNLPPDPKEEADKTIEGIDANANGIRDDVELAIFREYPDSAKTRAVLLQYALALQIQTGEININEVTATAIAERDSQSYDCIGQIVPRSNNDLEEIKIYRNFVENKQINTIERNKLKKDFDKKIRSFELQSGCDIDLTILPN